MKKRVSGKKLSRAYKARKALSRSLVRALVERGVIKTTKAKAKFIQGKVDKYINLAKKQTVASKRRLYRLLGNDRKTTEALYRIAKTNFVQRPGGYTRIINLPTRRGDAAEMVKLELIEEVITSSKSRTDRAGKTGKKRDIKNSKERSAKPVKKSV